MNWWNRLLRKTQLEDQLNKELLFHLEQHANDLVALGYSPQEARRRARIELGGLEQVKEECRDSRGTRWLEDLLQDFRYAVRSLKRKPGFAIVALLTLGLGNGATTIMFTLVNGVLLKPLPYAQPYRLVKLQERTEQATQFGNLWAFSYPNFVDLKREVRALEPVAAYRF